MKIFFQSSMPRAGSTLLQNILGQNPDFYVTPTSGVLELVYGARSQYTSSPEFKAQDADLMKKGFLNFCKNGLEGFYEGVTDKKYVVDKSRGWGIHYDFLNSFYEEPKIVCMVRDPRQILSSMEKNFRKNQDKHQEIENHAEMRGNTTQKRVIEWLNSQPVGLAFNRIQDIVQRGIDKNILFIRFEDLTENPEEEMKKVYEFFGVENYKHDFENVEQLTQEDDSVYGIFGDHNIRKKVEPLQKDYLDILGKQACDMIMQNLEWYAKKFGYF
ncbi:MAG: sulfotransferase [Candidatus Diapherotrites archaeon]|jgi:sulfotransferase|uniref:Sulfotransferase n=1 Tax=Candidatus Iainarchaeum sp. TaxID=3101447 RepID=A0A8T5GFC4_9ARCH|nr:sulfotransferase [Candidatus Diapherotrites archaeon]MBT7241648.1 sulfotransferase [Candidatus Diapherotrites archaeon]